MHPKGCLLSYSGKVRGAGVVWEEDMSLALSPCYLLSQAPGSHKLSHLVIVGQCTSLLHVLANPGSVSVTADLLEAEKTFVLA